MPDAAQYTLGLFDSSALGWSLTPPAAEQTAEEDTETEPESTRAIQRGTNYCLTGERQLARGWRGRARDNIAAIELSKQIENEGRSATAEEQERLLRFIGFGATELAQNAFPLPGAGEFRPGWAEIGQALADRQRRPSSRHFAVRPSMPISRPNR